MAFIGESERRHLNALYEQSRHRKSSLNSSSGEETSSSPPRQPPLRKQSSPAYLPSITVTRHQNYHPHHRQSIPEHPPHRANSVKVQHGGHQSRRRASAAANLAVVVPFGFRPRSSTLDGEAKKQEKEKKEEVDENVVYRRRNFDVSPKGIVTNKGDCYRPRSNSSINNIPDQYVLKKKERLLSVSSAHSEQDQRRFSLGGGKEEDDEEEFGEDPSCLGTSPANSQYRVLICGAPDVGKSAIMNQFLSSEDCNIYEECGKPDGVRLEKTVSILLDGQESDLNFIDIASLDYGDSITDFRPADAYLLIYNVTDRTSFESVIDMLFDLKQAEETQDKAIILVGNKSDLVRARIVSIEEGKSVAASYDCKFIETSAAIDINVDELLVGILKQIRLKEGKSASNNKKSKKARKVIKYRKQEKEKNKLTHTYEKACDLLTKLLSKSNSKSCGNLYVP